MGGCHVILVVTNDVAHVVACRLNSSDPDLELKAAPTTKDRIIDSHFYALNDATVGHDGLNVLQRQIDELRSAGAITTPIKWYCPMDSMRDFNGVTRTIPNASFEVGKLVDLPAAVKENVLKFSRHYFAKRKVVDNRVRGRFSRVTYRIPAAA